MLSLFGHRVLRIGARVLSERLFNRCYFQHCAQEEIPGSFRVNMCHLHSPLGLLSKSHFGNSFLWLYAKGFVNSS